MLLQEDSELSLLEKIAQQCAPQKEEAQPAATMVAEPSVTPETTFSETQPWNLPGFGPGARIITSFGVVPVEALRLRDPIKTVDGRFLKVQYVDTVKLDRRFLLTHPEAQPIIIPRNGLGADVPSDQILLSSANKVRVPGQFGKVSVRTAQELTGLSSISRKSHGYFTYHVFHCGEPCTVNVNGIWIDLDLGFLEVPED